MSDRFRLLYVVEYFPPHIGGAETLFGNAVEELARRGHDVTVVTIQTAEKAPKDEGWNGARVIRLPVPHRIDRYAFLIRAIPAALRHARRVDLIHTSIFTPAIPAWIASRVWRKPCVITVHDLFLETWDKFLGISPVTIAGHRFFESALMRLPFTQYVADSRYTAERSISINGRRSATTVVQPPVAYDFWHPGYTARPLRRELGLPDDTFIYLYFGRPGITKGVEYLVDAAAIVAGRLPNSRLVMLLFHEPVDRHQRILDRIDRLGLDKHIVVLPSQPRPELPSYLLAANAVIVPSISEGFGYSAVEAATIGSHVIATTGHSVEEVLKGYATFVPRCDAGALARAIIDVANGAPKPPIVPMRFTTAAHVDALEEVYARAIAAI